MNSRQRVLTAIDHQTPDRIPVDFGSHRSSGIAATAYARLRNHLSLPPRPIRIYDMVQQLAIIDPDVLELFGVDTVEMGRAFLREDRDWRDWESKDGVHYQIPFYVNVEKRNNDWYLFNERGLELGVKKEGCDFFEQTTFPLMERGIAQDDFDDLEQRLGETIWTGVPHPGAHLKLDDEGLAEMKAAVARLRQETDRAIVGLFGGNLFETPQWLYRMDNYLLSLALHPECVVALAERMTKLYLWKLERWLAAVGEHIDVILFGDDLGSQNGPLISPAMYREYYKPFHTKIWHCAKELSKAKVLLHSCGAIEPLLDDLLEAGVDAINPIQTSCVGMDPVSLKRKYGRRLTFWGGGCDTQEILPNASPMTVYDHVKRRMEIFQTNGGFIFQQIHNIMPNVPPANIKAMFDALRDFRG